MSKDVRWPGACCPGGEGSCESVCFSEDCAELAGTNNDAVYYEFHLCHENDVCGREVAPYCGDELAMRSGTRDRRTNLLVVSDSNATLNKKREILARREINYNSACIYKNENKDVVCSKETKKVCDRLKGIWSGLDDIGHPHQCSSIVSSELNNYVENNRKISSGIVNSWELGKSYLGLSNARYAGVIFSKSSTKGQGVEYWGNENTGPAEIKRIEKKTKKISSGISYAVFVHNLNNRVSHKTLGKYLSGINDINFTFTVPDLETSGFIYNSIRTSEFSENVKKKHNNNTDWYPLVSEYYLSSNHLKINGIDNKEYIHIQNMSTGFTSTCDTSKLMHVFTVLLIPILY